MNITPTAGLIGSDPDCAECERLWLELSNAAKAYVKIFEQHKGVAGRRHATPFTKLELRAAAEHRRWARKALKNHENTHARNNPQVRSSATCTLF